LWVRVPPWSITFFGVGAIRRGPKEAPIRRPSRLEKEIVLALVFSQSLGTLALLELRKIRTHKHAHTSYSVCTATSHDVSTAGSARSFRRSCDTHTHTRRRAHTRSFICCRCKKSTPAGLEPTRENPNRFRIYLLNHSDTAPYDNRVINKCILIS
jgi:hypothetical protein